MGGRMLRWFQIEPNKGWPSMSESERQEERNKQGIWKHTRPAQYFRNQIVTPKV